MTAGGLDHSFLEDTYKTLAQHTKRQSMSDSGVRVIRKELADCFFFKDDNFLIAFSEPMSVPFDSELRHSEIIYHTLESYHTESPKSWKGQLYASKDLILRVALLDKTLRIKKNMCES